MLFHVAPVGAIAAGHAGEIVAHGEDDGGNGAGAGSVEDDLAAVEQFLKALGGHAFEERELVGVVVVEGGSVDGGLFGYVSDGNFFKGLGFEELLEGLMEHVASAADPGVDCFARIRKSLEHGDLESSLHRMLQKRRMSCFDESTHVG